jgi:hypothetical protein
VLANFGGLRITMTNPVNHSTASDKREQYMGVCASRVSAWDQENITWIQLVKPVDKAQSTRMMQDVTGP